MNIVLDCEVILSKKLEAICEQGEPLSVLISSVSGNKGRATMRVVCKDGTKDADISKIGETSIQFKVMNVSEDIKTLSDGSRFTNIMSSTGGGMPQSAEQAIAKTSPDIPEGEPYVAPVKNQPVNPLEAVAGNPDAVKALMAILAAAGINLPKPQDNQAASSSSAAPTPPPRQVPAAPPRDNSISSYDELIAEINSIPGIDQEIRMPTDRKLTRGEADQILSRMPKLRKKAFIRNALPSQLLVGDLFTSLDGTGPCLALLPGQAFDLTRLPAKNILNSNDFRWCVEGGKITFVNYTAYAASFKQVNDEAAKWGRSEDLKVYGGDSSRVGPTEASGGVAESLASGAGMLEGESEMGGQHDGPSPITVNVESHGTRDDAPPSVPYEESPEMQNIISQMPVARQPQQRVPTRR